MDKRKGIVLYDREFTDEPDELLHIDVRYEIISLTNGLGAFGLGAVLSYADVMLLTGDPTWDVTVVSYKEKGE